MIKKSRQKLKYLENENRTFKAKQKAFFINFQGLSVAKNCLRPESAALKVFRKCAANFQEKTLRHGCSAVNLINMFRTSFPKNTSGWLL